MSKSDKSVRAAWVALVMLSLLLWYQSYEGRVHIWSQNVRYCTQITVPGTKDAAERDGDIQMFASSSQLFRESQGQHALAMQSAQIARNAKARADRARARGAVPCTDRFQKPSPFGN